MNSDPVSPPFWCSGGERGRAQSEPGQPEPQHGLSAELPAPRALGDHVPGPGRPAAAEDEAQPEPGLREEAGPGA